MGLWRALGLRPWKPSGGWRHTCSTLGAAPGVPRAMPGLRRPVRLTTLNIDERWASDSPAPVATGANEGAAGKLRPVPAPVLWDGIDSPMLQIGNRSPG